MPACPRSAEPEQGPAAPPPGPPPTLTRLSLPTLPRERWRNGLGWTRPVLQHADGCGLLWRISLAEITEPAPFSAFPGLQRTTVLVQGGPVALAARERRWHLAQPGDRADYPGEWRLRNRAPEHPALFWNVMAARDRVRADVLVLRATDCLLPAGGMSADTGTATEPLTAPLTTSVLWIVRGRHELSSPGRDAPLVLDAGQGLVCTLASARLHLRALSADALVIHTLLSRLG